MTPPHPFHPALYAPVPYQIASGRIVDKVRVAASTSAILIALPLVNWLLAQVGGPALTTADGEALVSLTTILYTTAVSLAMVVRAILRRPNEGDGIIREL